MAVVCAMRQGGRRPAFPKQSPFRTNCGLCAKIGLWGGRLVAQQLCLCCKELGAALGCPREPTGKGTGQDPAVIWVAEQARLTGEQVKPSLMTPSLIKIIIRVLQEERNTLNSTSCKALGWKSVILVSLLFTAPWL